MAVVLVTGGAGYIGSHTAKALAAEGHVPVVFDNMRSGHPWAVRFGPLVQGDLMDRRAILAALEEHRPAAVVHFAGLIEVGESVRDPVRFHRENTGGALNLMSAMAEAGVGAIVFSSTAAVYRPADQHSALSETDPIGPGNPYGHSKRATEIALEDAAGAGVLRHVTLRYFNAAGASEEAEIGEAHWPESHLVPLCLMAAAGDRPALKLFGTDYDTADGTCVRDYVHVADLAGAHVRAVDHLLADGGSLTCNLGSGTGASVRQVIRAVEKVTGLEVPFEEVDRRPGDVPVLVADVARARETLGWRPERSESLERIVADAWAWYQAAKSKGYLPGKD